MNKKNAFKLVLSVLLTMACGAIGGLFTAPEIKGWYSQLNQPSFNPPDWIFGPVWTLLYLLMGVSCFIIWKTKSGKKRNRALLIFIVQLILNFFWSFIFFYLKNIGFAMFEIFILWTSIVVMLILFYKVKSIAAWINLPYFLWVSFAAALNLAYFILN